MKKINITIDGLHIITNEGETILFVALQNNIYIPHLCHHPDLKPAGVCRICMVEVNKKIITACNTLVAEGMQIKTSTPEIEQMRKTIVELLLINHHGHCAACVDSEKCELRKVANYVGINEQNMQQYIKVGKKSVDDSNPFFNIDHNKCIKCGICVRTCDELQGLNVIDFIYRGVDSKVGVFGDKPLLESRCKSCGECAVRCPTNAMPCKTFQQPTREVKTICGYCGCGCGMYLGVRGNKVVSVRGDKENVSNSGSLCVKGRFGFDFINSEERLKTPLIKNNGKFMPITWDEAINIIAEKFAKYKKENFAMLASARATNEDNYIMQKFTRAVMGTNNIDHCARLCHAPSVAGLKQSFGSGAMTNSSKEIGKAKCILAIGTNTTEAHPIIALQIKKAVRNNGILIVANPQKIDLCSHATIFLQHYPGSDVALLMGIMKVIVDEGLYDKSFIKERCENFTEFKQSLAQFTSDFVEKVTGVAYDKIIAAAHAYSKNSPATILYAMGITQHTHGTDNVLATSNLALLTGNVGKESTGVNPLRGQNNVQGACDMGALPNVYPGYQAVNNPKVQEKFNAAWNAKLPINPGWTHVEMLDAIDNGQIKAMYIAGENPILSEANSKHAAAALKKLSFLLVQDIFLTETAQLADMVLPATTFAEKDGTFTNTERRVQRLHKAIEPIGEARNDWQIVCAIAKKLGATGFAFNSSEEIMQEITNLIPSYHGIGYQRLEQRGLQWPCLDENHPGTKFLYKDKFATENGKGKFMPLSFKPPIELPNEEYPFVLTTDRSIFHYHTATMTRKVPGLNKIYPHEFVRINPADAAELNISDGDIIKIASRRGEITASAKIVDGPPKGVVAMTFHFSESPTNELTNAALDPIAKTPETKVCAVKILKENQNP